MNLTLSADPELIRKTRELAARQGTSLNGLIRDYMRKATGQADADRQADEFARLAAEKGGRSPDGFVFNREDAHRR